jgi:hypothetical protein
VYGLFAQPILDDSMRQERERQVETRVKRAAEDIKRSGLIEYHTGRIAGLNMVRKLLREAAPSPAVGFVSHLSSTALMNDLRSSPSDGRNRQERLQNALARPTEKQKMEAETAASGSSREC